MKKNKFMSIAAMALSALIMIGSINSAFAAGNVRIEVNGLAQAVDSNIINKNGYNLVGLRMISEILDADVDWNSTKRCATVTKNGKKITVYADTGVVEKDGKNTGEKTITAIENDSIMIPIRFISEAFDATVDWEQASRKITITTDTGKYILLNDSKDVSEGTMVLTFDEALEMANNNNSNLKNLADSADYLDQVRDDLGDSLKRLDMYGLTLNSYPVDGEGMTQDAYTQLQQQLLENVSNSISVARSIKSVDIQKAQLPLNEEMLKDSSVALLKNYVMTLRNTEMNIELLEESIKLGEENIKNLELKNSLGYASDNEVASAKNTQKNNEASLTQLKLSYENQKQNLKTFLGLSADKEVYVDMDVKFDALNGIDLETYIVQKTQADPSIRILKDNVDIAKYNASTSGAVATETHIQMDNNLKSAQRALKDGQDNMEKNIRNAYNQLKQLEENDKSLKVSLEQAIRDYNTVVTSYETGRATIYQVNQAKLGVLKAEQAIESNALNYDVLSFTFERPYLLS
ncbi:MAG: TolC family protein [Firmicutes bacterium]|nr:TolC family protein [Bacillota bacterium]